MSVSITASNGVGYNYTYTVTAADALTGYVLFDFNSDQTVTADITRLAANGAILASTDNYITYPAAGQIKVAAGTGAALVAGQYIIVIGGIDASLKLSA